MWYIWLLRLLNEDSDDIGIKMEGLSQRTNVISLWSLCDLVLIGLLKYGYSTPVFTQSTSVNNDVAEAVVSIGLDHVNS